MGNEMGNSNTSGLREGDDQFQDKSLDDVKGQNHVLTTLDKEDSNGGDQHTDNRGEDSVKGEGKKSWVEVAQMDDVKGQNQEVSASEVYKMEKETNLPSINLEGVAEEPHDYKDEEKSSLNAALEDKNGHEIQAKLVSSEPEAIASTYVDEQKQDQRGEDNSTNTETEEKSLQEAANTDETKAQSDLNPAAADEKNNGIETGLVLSDPDGIASSCADNQKQDEEGTDAEEDNTLNDEAMGKSSQEAVNIDVVEKQDHLIPGVEDRYTQENETVPVSYDPEGTADLKVYNSEQVEKEEENTDTTEPQENPLLKDARSDDIKEKDPTIAAAEGEAWNNGEINADLALGDLMVLAHNDQILEGQETGTFELHPPTESTTVEAKSSEATDEGRLINQASLPENLEDHEMYQESILEENPSDESHHLEEQNSVIKEDEGTRGSMSDAASDNSHDSVPQEPAVVEPEQSDIDKISCEELLQVCNGLQNSDHMITPYLDCSSQGNGVSDSSLSTEMIKSVFPDLSPEAEQEMNGLFMKEMATKEQFEVKDKDEAGNNSENATLPNGVEAKCNAEMASEMKSVKTDSPELHVDEAQDFKLEISETEDKGIVVSDKAVLVREVTENGNSKHSHCQILSWEEETKADEQNASPPHILLNGHQNKDKRCLMFNTSSDSNSSKDYQIEEAKIVENVHLIDASINSQNEEQQKNSEEEAPLVTDPADNLLSVQKLKEEEFEEKKIIQKLAEKKVESKKLENSNESMVELNQQSSGEISPTAASSFVPKNLTENSLISMVELAGEKPLLDLSESPKATVVTMAETKPSVKQPTEQCAITNGNYLRQESVSTESNPDNMIINSQMHKSPSFDLHLRIEAKTEESDQTPLLYQDKTTIRSSSQHEAMAAEEKVVTLEKSDSEESKTPFLGFLKEEEEETAHMLFTPKKQDYPSSAMKASTKVSVKEFTSALGKGKEKRKPRTSLFGPCMCCAAVIN